MVCFAWAKNGAGKVGMVDGVGIVLGFETKGVVLVVNGAVGAFFAVEEIAGVELNAGLCGPDFHAAAGCRFGNNGSQSERPILRAKNEVVIVSDGITAHCIQILPDGFWFREVDRCIFNAGDLSGGDESSIDGRIVVGAKL